MQFYLGTHRANWLEELDVPLFVSHRRLSDRRSLPRAKGRWALDSGGFTEIDLYGKWVTSPASYVEAVERYEAEIGNLAWAAPMDWMCEPRMIEKTGLSVREHQERTVANYLELRDRGPFIPVLQGWAVDDYLTCVDLYASAGVDLAAAPLVGVGSVCRRQHLREVGDIVSALQPLKLHGFGVKKDGVKKYGHFLSSSDSLSWSTRARWKGSALAECAHRSCQNCARFALQWRDELICSSLFVS